SLASHLPLVRHRINSSPTASQQTRRPPLTAAAMALAAAQRQRSASAVLVAAVLLSLSLSLSCVQAQAPHVAVPPSAPPKAAAAPGPAGGLSAACLNSLLNMSDCLPYVQAGSKARAPDKPCCPELAGMVGSNPVCLCELLSGAADSLGIAVDYARALALPGVCRVATPPITTCAGSKLTRALLLQLGRWICCSMSESLLRWI
uniref:Bifunctional inhibitor/plant lipid transfer protein/seed storage helical domain-containing protein n=1 Tax=Aegilops tauschii subsp. strangulata TaxID=200361 RepID=A0A452ZDQ6_AEGTS